MLSAKSLWNTDLPRPEKKKRKQNPAFLFCWRVKAQPQLKCKPFHSLGFKGTMKITRRLSLTSTARCQKWCIKHCQSRIYQLLYHHPQQRRPKSGLPCLFLGGWHSAFKLHELATTVANLAVLCGKLFFPHKNANTIKHTHKDTKTYTKTLKTTTENIFYIQPIILFLAKPTPLFRWTLSIPPLRLHCMVSKSSGFMKPWSIPWSQTNSHLEINIRHPWEGPLQREFGEGISKGSRVSFQVKSLWALELCNWGTLDAIQGYSRVMLVSHRSFRSYMNLSRTIVIFKH